MKRLALMLVLTAAFPVLHSLAMAQQPTEGRRPPPGRPGMRAPSEAEKEAARVRIGITKEQQQQLEAILEETGKATRALFDQLREKHEQLTQLYDSYDIDREREKALFREIARLRVRLLQVHSEHETKVRQVLTREQHARMRALMKEAMEDARRRWRTPPPEGGKPKP